MVRTHFHHNNKKQIQTHTPRRPAITENLQLTLKIQDQNVLLLIKDRRGATIQIDMAYATVFVISKEQDSWFKLYPDENEQLIGTGKFTLNQDLKFEVTLRLPGEKPINASFTPAISEKPTRIMQ